MLRAPCCLHRWLRHKGRRACAPKTWGGRARWWQLQVATCHWILAHRRLGIGRLRGLSKAIAISRCGICCKSLTSCSRAFRASRTWNLRQAFVLVVSRYPISCGDSPIKLRQRRRRTWHRCDVSGPDKNFRA